MNHLRFLLNPRETYYRSQHTPVARLLRRAETIIDASCRLYLIVVFIVSMAALNTALTLKFGNQPEDHSEYHAKLLFYWKDALAEPVTVHGPESPENTVFSRNLKNASMNFVVHSQDSASRVLQQSFRTSKISGKLIFRVFAISCMATL